MSQYGKTKNFSSNKTTFDALALSLLAATFSNSLDPDQDRQNVGPDLDPNSLTLW